jgi:hypothetical protein
MVVGEDTIPGIGNIMGSSLFERTLCLTMVVEGTYRRIQYYR